MKMPRTWQELRAWRPKDKTYYAAASRLPTSELLEAAMFNLRRQYSGSAPRKPRVRVFQRAGKEWFVVRAGRRVASAHSWDSLIRKAALSPWQVFDRTVQLKKRWRE